MTTRRALVAVGAGLTTLLLVGGLVTALLPVAFSAIVGLPVGALAGLLVTVLTLGAPVRPGTPLGRVAGAYATVGYVLLALAALSYANLAGFRGTLSVVEWAAVAVAASVLVYVGLMLRDRGTLA